MAPHWITAGDALSLLGGHLSYASPARFALCTRALEKLVATKARLLTAGDKRAENASIPSGFWWAAGHEAMDQNWAIGDFSTSVNGVPWRALGVVFDFNGLRDMLPLEKASLVARELSVAGNPAWLSAKSARAFMYNDAGANPVTAGERLIDQCRLGFVAARSVQMQRADSNNPGVWSDEAREWDIPIWFWEHLTHEGTSRQDWERGLFTGKGRGSTGVLCEMVLNGVHFAESSLRALLPPVATPDVEVGAALAGGRPSRPFWEDLLCAIAGQIFRGELIPERQAQVERAILDWASLHGHGDEVSESSAKIRARKIFVEYQREGKNP